LDIFCLVYVNNGKALPMTPNQLCAWKCKKQTPQKLCPLSRFKLN